MAPGDGGSERTILRGEGDERTRVPRCLLVGTGQDVVSHLLPAHGVLTVGRAPDAGIQVKDGSVSRLHLRLHLGSTVRVEDLGSANGTSVGGLRIAPGEQCVLPPGQVVELDASWMTIANSRLTASSSSQGSAPPRESSSPAAPNTGKTGAHPVLVVEDEKMRAMHHLVARVATSDIRVLLHGETGVGKEVFARRLHDLSPRAAQPLIGIK